MGLFRFDKMGFLDKPSIVLCNPNKQYMYSLGNAYNQKLSLKYNTLSEFTFDLHRQIQNDLGENVIDPAYDFLDGKRVVYINELMWFQISNVEEDFDGTDSPFKSVTCTSLESELLNKQLASFSGTLKFYDAIDPTGTLMDLILADTGWTVGDVDPDLWNIYRTFDIASNTVYNALMNDVETAYGCVFTFDTDNKLVNAYALNNANYNTDIFISFDNLIKQAKFSKHTDELATVLNVFGGGGLDIRNVNPLGTNKIYNFSYYQTLDWMSQDLITAITNWQNEIADNQINYSALLVQLQNQNISLSTLQGDLSILNDTMSGLIETKKVRVEQGLSLTAINSQIAAQQVLINSKKSAITNKRTAITNTTNQIIAINDDVSFENNFTPAQLVQLKSFMIENVYQNENIIITDSMSPQDIQTQAQELYDQALNVLDTKTSLPRYEFEMSTANILALKEFEPFGNQINLGALVTVQLRDGLNIITGLLEINISFDKLDDFSLVFSNRLRLDNGQFQFADTINSMNKAATTTSFSSSNWNQYVQQKDTLLNITSILNTANNQLINSSSQEITIDTHGLIGRKSTGVGTYSNQQLWMTNNILAFSDDGFATSKLAIGNITLPSGGTAYGIAGQAIFGNLLAGNSLVISDTAGSFIVDNGGVRITNGAVSISNGTNTITLNPQTGINIKKNSNGSNIFFVNSNGDLVITGSITAVNSVFSGSITALSGTIGTATQGLKINSTGISTLDNVNHIDGTGNLHWGALDIQGNVATFSGTVNASKLNGLINGGTQIQDNSITSGKIISLVADKISVGTLTGVSLFGGSVSYGGTAANPNVQMFGDSTTGYFKSKTSIQMYIDNAGAVGSTIFLENVNGDFSASIYAPAGNPLGSKGTVFIGAGLNTIKMFGNLNLNAISSISPSTGTNGYNGSVQVNTINGLRTFTITKGFITNIN